MLIFFEKIKKLNSIIVILLLTSCVFPEKGDKDQQLPEWYHLDGEDENYLYGSGVGITVSDAINDALVDAISKLAINVEKEVDNKVNEYRVNNDTFISRVDRIKITLEIKDIFIPEYKVVNKSKFSNENIVKVSLKKEEIIKVLKILILSEENKILSIDVGEQSKGNVLSEIKTISSKLAISRKVDYLHAVLSSLTKEKYTYKRSAYLESLLENRYKKIKIYFQHDMNADTYPDLKNKITSNFKKTLPVSEYTYSEKKKFLFPIKEMELDYFPSDYDASNDGRFIVVFSNKNPKELVYIDLLSKKTRKIKINNKVGAVDIKITNNGKYVVLVNDSGYVFHVNLSTGKSHRFKVGIQVDTFDVSLNGRSIIFGGSNGEVSYWDLSRGRKIRDLVIENRIGRTYSIIAIKIINDGKDYVFIDMNGHLTIMNLKSKKIIESHFVFNDKVYDGDLSVSSDGFVFMSKTGGKFRYEKLISGNAVLNGVSPKRIIYSGILKNNKYAIVVTASEIKLINLVNFKKNIKGESVYVYKGIFYDIKIRGKHIFNIISNILKIYSLTDEKIAKSFGHEMKNKEQEIYFTINSCSQAYRAIRGNKKFWQSGGVDVFRSCNRIFVFDGLGKELYSKAINLSKVIDYKSLKQANIDSYNKRESQDSIKRMLKEMRVHDELQYLFRGKK